MLFTISSLIDLHPKYHHSYVAFGRSTVTGFYYSSPIAVRRGQIFPSEMTKYDKLTVVEIRAEFKARGIPATGLTRKQQLIDRLLEVDVTGQQEEGSVKIGEGGLVTTQGVASAPNDIGAPYQATASDGGSRPVAQEEAAVAAPNIEEQTTYVLNGATGKPTSDLNPGLDGSSIQSQEGPSSVVGDPTLSQAVSVERPISTSEDTIAIPQTLLPLGEQTKNESPSMDPVPAVVVLVEPEDSRKRKRRSLTPDVKEEEIAQKRRRASEDGDETGDQSPIADSKVNAQSELSNDVVESAPLLDVPAASQSDFEHPTKDTSVTDPAKDQHVRVLSPLSSHAQKSQPHKDARYKDLFAPSTAAPDGATKAYSQDRNITPSLHAATSALYIRNLKRPLQPQALESHLETLAQPPSDTSPISPITAFHLDTLRTHALVLFTSSAAAARVRSELHAAVWPPEPTREPLWVDFVPEESLEDWIEIERNSLGGGRGAGAKRWEVVYEGGEARLQEVSSSVLPPSGPRASFAQSSIPPPRVPTPEVQHAVPSTEAAKPAPFLALDGLFKSTVAKPKLYFLPVATDLAHTRLDEIDARTTNRGEVPPGGSGYRDSRRYTFEDERLVDGGPEFGLRVERGGPGPRGGRGRGGGGWRGR